MKRWFAALLCLCLLSNSITVSAAPVMQDVTGSVYTADSDIELQEVETALEETTVAECDATVSENELPKSSETGTEVTETTVEEEEITEAILGEMAEGSSEETGLMMQEMQGEADTFEVDTLYYQVLSEEDKTVVLTGVDRTKYSVYGGGLGEAAEITVPSTVDHNGVTYHVTEIGEFAFADYTFDAEYGNPLQGYDVPVIGEGELPMSLYVDKIIVSDGVKKIGAGAFYRIFQLDEVVLPDSIEEIGMAAFYLDSFRIGVEEYGEPLVWKVNIPKNVKTIGSYAYSGVNFEGTLVIPNGVTTIGEYAFGWEDTFDNYSVVDVPASVTTIGKNAFHISSLVKAVLRTTSMPAIDTWDRANVYNAAMFGKGYVSNLVIYVPADLIESYESSYFQNFLTDCQFLDIAGYVPEETIETETFHFVCDGETVTELEIKLTQTKYITVAMDNEAISYADIVWELEVTDGLENESTDPVEYLEFTDNGAGTLSLKAKNPGYLRLTGKVAGYENVTLEIANLYTTENEAIAFINRMNALTADEIEAQKAIRTDMGTSAQIAEIREKAEEITKNCTTDREKIFAIEQWMAGHIAYDYDYLQYYKDGTGFIKTVPYGAYEVLQNHFTVCGGFSNLAEAMLRSIGIPCVQIFGLADDTPDNKAADHAWNAAYDGDAGKWIYFDATWDSTSMLSGSYFTSGEPNTEWFDYNAEEACKKRFIADSTLDRENDPDYKPVHYVKSDYITLYVGETKKLEFLEGVEYSSLVAKGDYLEWDSDFVSYGYEKVRKEDTFITVDADGNVTGVKEGMGIVEIDGCYEIVVRVLAKEELAFEKNTYTIAMGSAPSVEVLQADVPVTGLMKYTSDDTSVVTIDEDGVLTPVSLGTATITGYFYCNDSYTVSCTVEVVESVAEETTTFELDDLIYEVDTKPQGDVPGTVSVIGESFGNLESSRSITVTIPETLTYDGDTYTVTRIGPEAFTNLIGNATLTIPASVKRIERKAFYGPRSRPGTELTGELVFPKDSQLEYIGFYAFADNPQLTKVDLSNCTKLHTIEDYAFSSCSYSSTTVEGDSQTIGIKEVILPESVKEIGEGAFYLSQNLTTINFPKNIDYIGYWAFAATDLAGVVDLSGVKDMDEQAFFRVFDIKGFVLNDDWTEIPDGLFAGASVKWAASKSLVEEAGGADKMESGSLLLSEKVTHIGEEAFSGCGYITKVQAPGVISVGKRAFANCISVESFDFEQNLTVIPEKAFINCNAVKEFTLNKDITEIGYGALYGLNKVTDMYLYSEKIDTFGNRCLPIGISVYIPLSVSDKYMKALESCNVEFYDLDGNPLGTTITGMEAYLKDYPIYEIGDSYDIFRDAICVYLEYSDNTFREITDFTIERGTIQSGRQEITITYGKYTDIIVIGECENETPVYALHVMFPGYIYPVYKVGDSFQKIRESATVSVILNENFQTEGYVKQEVENYDISPGFFKEGLNEVTISYCDFVYGRINTTTLHLEATVTGEDPNKPPAFEPVIKGLAVDIKEGGALENPIAGHVVQKEDLVVKHIVETASGREFVETTDYTITNTNLVMGDNTVIINSLNSAGETMTAEMFFYAVAKPDALDVQLKKGVKLKAGDVAKPSRFTATVSYVGENDYREKKQVTDFIIEGDATIHDGMNVLKFSYTETTFAYGTVTQKTEWSFSTDDKPVLSTTALTINRYADDVNSFTVYMPFELTARLDGVFYKNNKGKVQDGMSYTVSDNGLCTVQISDVIGNKAYNLFVKVWVEETENTYYMPIKITLKNTLPSITATAGTLNLFFTDEESRTLDLKVKNPSAEEITAVSFEENSPMDKYFDVVFDKELQTIALKLTDNTASKKDIIKKGKLLVWIDGYNSPVKVTIQVAVTEEQPKLKLTPDLVTVNTKLHDSRESTFEVSREVGKNYVPVSLTGTTPEFASFGELFDEVIAQDNKVTLKWKDSADFNAVKKVKVKLQADNWKSPITVTHKIKTVSILPKAVLDAKTLTLDMRAIGADAETALRFDTHPGDITYADLPESLSAVKNADKAPEVTLEKIDEQTYAVRTSWSADMQKGTYKYEVVPKLSDGTELKKVNLTVKVTTADKAASATWKAKNGSKIDLLRRDSTKYVYGILPTVKGTFIKEVILKEVKLGSGSVDKTAFDVNVNMQDGVVETVEVAASKNGELTAGKKYKLIFDVTPATETEELTSAEVSITVTPKESELKLNANAKSVTLYRFVHGMQFDYEVTPKTDGVKIARMEYVPGSSVPEGAFEISKTGDGTFTIKIADRMKVKKDKTYTLKFVVSAEGGNKNVTQTLKIKVK